MNAQYKKIVEVAALAGRIMLESQAESYRIEDTVERILKISQCETTEVFSNTTGLFITLDDPQIEPITLIRRIRHRGTHLRKIYRVNQISRQLTAGQISIEQAEKALHQVDEAEYSVVHFDIAIFLLVTAFALLLGGSTWDIISAAIASLFVMFGMFAQQSLSINQFLTGALTTALLGFFMPLILSYIPTPHSLDIIIVSALMPLFPGTAFTNGIRDTLKGDYVSGVAKISEALVIAMSLGTGVAFGLFLANGVLQ